MYQHLPSPFFPAFTFSGKAFASVLILIFSFGTAQAQLSVDFATEEPVCFGVPNGSITAIASGGVGPYSFVWNTGATGPLLANVPGGDYSVTVTDSNGGSVSGNVTLTQPPLLDVLFDADTCSIPFDATAMGAGGTPPYTYNWSTGVSGPTITINGLGIYCVTVTDANLCSAIDCIKLVVPPLNVNVNTGEVTCPDGDDGTLTATAGAGVPPYTYLWSNGATTSTITGLTPGTYTVTVTDAGGCSASAGGTVADQTPILIDIDATQPNCLGDNDGTATATASGGTPPFTYGWSTGESGQTVTGLAPGTYTVTATDAEGCEAVDSVTISNLSNLTVGGVGTAETCPGANDGFATASAQNGVLPYTYQWSNGGTTQVQVGVAPGTYSVTVTDAVGCSGTTNVMVPAAPAFEVEATGTDITTCGAADGTASAVVTAGIPPFLYEWNTGQTTPTITGLAAGTYVVTVTNFNSCEAIDSITIVEPPPVTVSITGITQVCEGENDGSLSVVISGGTGPFTILWSTGADTQSINGLGAGAYSVIVVDANGCNASAAVVITELPAPEVTITATEIVCGTGNTGTATAQGSGGLPPYAFLWSTGETTATAAGLTSGVYSVTITDANQCTATAEVTITVIDDLSIMVDVDDVDCFGENTGSAAVMVTGGTQPYTYQWSTGDTGSSITGQPAGTYAVTATDTNGCAASTTAVINQPTQLVVTINNPDPMICPGEATGSLLAVVNGGTTPYSYLWSTGATTPMISNLSAGTYTVTVTDANDCVETAEATITESPQLEIDITATEIVCAPETTGQASVSVSGGIPPYSFLWSTGESSESIDGLGTGVYSVTVVDANQCSAVAEVTIEVINDLEIVVTPRDVLCFGGATGSILVQASGGDMPYSYFWSTGVTGVNELEDLPVGTYAVTVADANGCSLSQTITINQPAELLIDATGVDPLCFGNADGSATAAATGGTPPYSFVWSNGVLTAANTGLPAGTYSVTVVDANLCEAVATVILTDPPQLEVTVTTPIIQCAGADTGSATAVVSGGAGPYSYLWSTGETTATITGLTAGIYQLTVTDANGCQEVVQAISVAEIPELTIDFDVTNIICTDAEVGAVNTLIAGGTPPYTYAWSTGAVTPGISGLPAGTYFLTVTDANDCITTGSATVVQTPALDVTIDATDVSCPGDDNGVATALVQGGTMPFTYNWSNGSTQQTLTGLAPGVYSVTVTDEEGCSGEASTTINEPDDLSLTLSSTTVTCFASADGTASVSVSGGTGPYTYLWNTGDTEPSLTGLPAGTYSVTVTDANGCTTDGAVDVNEPDQLTLTTEVLSGSCIGDAGGSAQVLVSGGTPPYSYEWSDGSTSSQVNNLPPGVYSVTVTDTNGCPATANVVLQPYPNPVCTAEVTALVNMGDDGEAMVTVTGGTPPFSYEWSDGQTTATAVNLSPGTYTVTVTDANGCTTDCEVTMQAPARVGDFVWLDLDRDGLQDPNEPGIPGVTVIITEIDEDDPPYADTTVTDANGIYGFIVPPPGNYKITFILPPGSTLTPTTPNVGANDAIDSDADTVMLMTDPFFITYNDVNLTFDAGFTTICENITDAGEIGPMMQTLCGPGNDPDPIVNIETPSGGVGEIEYLWMVSTIGGPFNDFNWSPIPGSTTPDYDPGPLYETTYFIRCARRENCTAYLESNMVTIKVDSVAVADIQGPSLVCEDDVVTFTAAGVGPDAVISWDFGPAANPGTATGPSADVFFHSFGNFTIWLTVTENGCTATNFMQVVVINSPTYCGNGMPLNVDVTEEEAVVLNWEMQDDDRDYSFTVEHSVDRETFVALGSVVDPARTEGQTLHYEFRHTTPKRGLNYYRVKVADQTGQTAYSDVAEAILYNDSKLMLVYPNPVTDQLTLELFETYNEEVTLEFFAVSGVKVRQVKVQPDAERLQLDLSRFAAGIYFLRVLYNGEEIKTIRIMKK